MKRTQFTLRLGITAIIIFVLSACGATQLEPNSIINDVKSTPSENDFFLINETTKRISDRSKYFGHEYKRIANRQASTIETAADSVPSTIVGLGLSGGGIRSAAFQAGVLSGLLKNTYKNSTLLSRVDYISSVSGGSWITGAYWAWQDSDQKLFDCLDKVATLGEQAIDTGCSQAAKALRSIQPITAFKNTKEHWETDIQNAYLSYDCKDMEIGDKSHPCWKATERKPYPIIMATHSSIVNEGGDIKNLPFEYTLDYLGTIADCDVKSMKGEMCGIVKKARNGEKRPGFFVSQTAKDFNWQRRKNNEANREPGKTLARILAQSSSVVGTAKGLSWSMELAYKNKSISEIRDNYWISDGGWTENLGLIPLVERGTDLIVLSDMGQALDIHSDFELAKKQVEKLFDCKIENSKDFYKGMMRVYQYTCGKSSEPDKVGTIVYIKPFFGIRDEFIRYLDQSNLHELSLCIMAKDKSCYTNEASTEPLPNEYRFPQTDTFEEAYDKRLIRSYYLLGKYVADHLMAPKLLELLART